MYINSIDKYPVNLFTVMWLKCASATAIEPVPRYPVLQAQPLVPSIYLKFLSYPYTFHIHSTVYLFLFLLMVQRQISSIPHSLYHPTPTLVCILSALTSPNTPHTWTQPTHYQCASLYLISPTHFYPTSYFWTKAFSEDLKQIHWCVVPFRALTLPSLPSSQPCAVLQRTFYFLLNWPQERTSHTSYLVSGKDDWKAMRSTQIVT